MTVILIGLVVGAGITLGWFVTSKVTQFFEWLERRR